MKKLLATALILSGTTLSSAQIVDLTDLWMACDLAQVDAGGDAPMAASIGQVSFLESAGDRPKLQLLAVGQDGEALFCEMEIDVVTFRHGSETIIDE